MIHICSKFQKNLQSWGGCSPIRSQLGGLSPLGPLSYTTDEVTLLDSRIGILLALQIRKPNFESDYEKLLGVTFDKKLSFKKHVEDLSKKASQKLHALARLSNYIDPIKSEILMNSFIRSQFNYCPLVWMFHDRTTKARFIVEKLLLKAKSIKEQA